MAVFAVQNLEILRELEVSRSTQSPNTAGTWSTWSIHYKLPRRIFWQSLSTKHRTKSQTHQTGNYPWSIFSRKYFTLLPGTRSICEMLHQITTEVQPRLAAQASSAVSLDSTRMHGEHRIISSILLLLIYDKAHFISSVLLLLIYDKAHFTSLL